MQEAGPPTAASAPVPVPDGTDSGAPSDPAPADAKLEISRAREAGRIFDGWLPAFHGLMNADSNGSWTASPPPRSEADARARLCDDRDENEHCRGSGPWLVDVVVNPFYGASHLVARTGGEKLLSFARILSNNGGQSCHGLVSRSHIEPGAPAHVVVDTIDSEPLWVHAASPDPKIGTSGVPAFPWRSCRCLDDSHDRCENGCEERCLPSTWAHDDTFYDLARGREILKIHQEGSFELGSESDHFRVPFTVVSRPENVLLVGGGSVRAIGWDR